jgi:hypothetical protein
MLLEVQVGIWLSIDMYICILDWQINLYLCLRTLGSNIPVWSSNSQAPVAHTCNASYLGGWDQENPFQGQSGQGVCGSHLNQ